MAGPKEQPLPPDVMGRDDAVEVLRAFVIDGGLSIAFQRAFEGPEMWGLLLVDIARPAPRACARARRPTWSRRCGPSGWLISPATLPAPMRARATLPKKTRWVPSSTCSRP